MNRHDGVRPEDPSDAAMLAVLAPPGHRNPRAADRVDLAVIGGGPGGLVCAHGAAGLGARVALAERALLGGDCLVSGCVPSKALLHAASEGPGAASRAFAHARAVRAAIAPHDGVDRLERAGVAVYLGHARFTGPDTLDVDGQIVRFVRAIVATGAHGVRPPVPGLDHPDILDAAGVWGLDTAPARAVVLGAGPIGCELAQALARLGSVVTLIDKAPTVLGREDPDAAAVVARALREDGVALRLGVGLARVDVAPGGVTVHLDDGTSVHGDRTVAALGRRPRLDDLGLDAADIATAREGIVVDDRLRTTNPHVYAVGDVVGGGFTHVADAMARVALQNALVAPTARWSARGVSWCTYTTPELAHVGPAHADLVARGDLTPHTVPWRDLDRGQTDGVTDGFLRVWVDRKGVVIAVTAVGPNAGEGIALGALAVQQRLHAVALSSVILPYPTLSEAYRRVGDTVRRTRLTPMVAGALRWWIRRRGAG